jgi:uncharacterized protein HemX/uroporphyrinogen-III synthase
MHNSSTQPLAGLTILNTRPQAQSRQLTETIQQLGGSSIELPLLNIETISPQEWLKYYPEKVDVIIFISANAVHHSLPDLKKDLRQSSPKIIAIGKATQAALQYHQVKVDFTPARFDSETLISDPILAEIKAKSVVIVKGNDGRQVLQHYLKEQGANLCELIVYKRTPPKELTQNLKKIWQNNNIDIILISSNTSFKNLMDAIPERYHSKLASCHWLVISKRIKEELNKHSFNNITTAPNADFYQALSDWQKDENMSQDKPKTPEKNTPVATPSSNHASPFAKLSLIVGIAAIATSLYTLNQLNASKSVLTNEVQKMQQGLAEQQSKQFSSMESSIVQQKKQLSAKQSQVSQQLQALETNLNALTIQKKGDDQTWQLNRAAYLINLAQLSLNWEQDPSSSIQLLNSADNIIKNLDNPIYMGIRQTLSNELASLKAAPKVDVTGLLSQLSATNKLVKSFALKQPLNDGEKVEQASNTQQQQPKWKQTINTGLSALSKIVVIRKHKTQFQTLLSKEDHQMIIHQIQLSIKQAQWALLHRKQYIFQYSLKQAHQMIAEYFDTNTQGVMTTLAGLQELSNENIAPKLPTIGRSYQQIKEIIAKQNQAAADLTKGDA